MNRFRNKNHCRHCGHTWLSGKTYDSAEEAENAPLPKRCPNLACGEIQAVRGMDFNSNKAPATIGANNTVKAIDETEKIVTQDYGLTDLNIKGREGDTAAPKLPARLQAQADAMFNPQARRQARANPNLRPSRVISMAAAGRMRDPHAPDAMKLIHDAKQRPNVRFVNEN